MIFPEAKDRYSGIFQSGSECIIARFSMANKPTAKTSVPALALKFFIDKEHPSVNLHLMHSVDGQDGHNFFAQPFSNILPPANSFATRLLDRFLAKSLWNLVQRSQSRPLNTGTPRQHPNERRVCQLSDNTTSVDNQTCRSCTNTHAVQHNRG